MSINNFRNIQSSRSTVIMSMIKRNARKKWLLVLIPLTCLMLVSF